MGNNRKLRDFYILWSTQSLSHLGSAMTSFALTLWLFDKTGSALSTAALTICTYAPYVVMSIFAGAISDKFDKKKTMLVCDALAALTTVLVFVLYKTDTLSMWHLYVINAFSGLMNTVQQPASEVANTLLVPKEQYQRTSALQSLSGLWSASGTRCWRRRCTAWRGWIRCLPWIWQLLPWLSWYCCCLSGCLLSVRKPENRKRSLSWRKRDCGS